MGGTALVAGPDLGPGKRVVALFDVKDDFAALAVTVNNLLTLPPNSHFKRWAAQVSELPE